VNARPGNDRSSAVATSRWIRVFAVALLAVGGLHAATVTVHGSITLLQDASMLGPDTSLADFNDGTAGDPVDPSTYSSLGLDLDPDFAGIYSDRPNRFKGSNDADGLHHQGGFEATFSEPMNQFGLTAGRNADTYLTVYDTAGDMIGQVDWEPDGDPGFIGIDTGGVEIGMIRYGNDDLWNGRRFTPNRGQPVHADNWRFGYNPVPEPHEWLLILAGLTGLGFFGWRQRPGTLERAE